MEENFEDLLDRMLTALHAAEKRHRAVRDSASDSSNWSAYDNEVKFISDIIKWRRDLEPLRMHIVSSGAVIVEDVPQAAGSSDKEPVPVSVEDDPAAHRFDDERIGRYVRRKMKDLSNAGFAFPAEGIANLQNAQWCFQVLNIAHPFFLQTTQKATHYWKSDIFIFNGRSFRLCMEWYNDLYRGRSQRECFDNWYNSLSIDTSSESFKDGEEIRIGEYIRSKLRELSNSGFAFTEDQIKQLGDVEWSSVTFAKKSFLPIARIAKRNQDISLQIRDDRGKVRYWNELFSFGKTDLLFTNRWKLRNRESFDRWYEKLSQVEKTIAADTLIFRKTVNWSMLNYGFSVPASNWGLLFDAIGGAVDRAAGRKVSVDVAGVSCTALVSCSVSGNKKTVQIRYPQNSGILSYLRESFADIYAYCIQERNLHGKDRRIDIPSDMEGSISIYAAKEQKALRIDCGSHKIGNGVEAQAETVIIHAKSQFNGDGIVEVSNSFVPILKFPDRNFIICAKLNADAQSVSFRAEAEGSPHAEKSLTVAHLKEVALLERSKRIHRVAVPESVNVRKKMMFMAWIDPPGINIQEETPISQPLEEP
ncbi:MAG: hypothetical protein LBU32_06020 [Clostridiales bacterium]|nr:hypothetical protein [Clostridiales bacterium]